jgi:hypothetical protein
MVKAFEILKANLFSNLYITCLAHSLNRVYDAIREKYSSTNLFISSMKQILKKSNNRRQNFKNITKLSLPPISVKIRRGLGLNLHFIISTISNKYLNLYLNLRIKQNI